jgi:peroxiredoxin
VVPASRSSLLLCTRCAILVLAVCICGHSANAQTPASEPPAVQHQLDQAAQFESDHNIPFAIDSLEKANRLENGKCVPCLVQLADIYRDSGDNMRSAREAAVLEDTVTTPAQKAAAAAMEGTALMREGVARKKTALLRQAQQQFAQAEAWDPANMQLVFLNGVALGRLGEYPQAQKEFAKYTASKDVDPLMQGRARRYLADPELVQETMAPAFSVRAVNGQTLNLDQLHGRVVLLYFWATDCNSCIGDLPRLRQIVEQFKGQPLTVLSISTDRNPDKWRDYIGKHPMDWPQYWDEDQQMAALYGASSLPRYIAIDARGVIRSVVVEDNADIVRRLQRLVQQAEEHSQPSVAAGENHP